MIGGSIKESSGKNESHRNQVCRQSDPGYVLSYNALHDFYFIFIHGEAVLPPRKNTMFSFLANIDIITGFVPRF